MSNFSTTGVSFSGLATGIDTDSIVSQLAALDQAPIKNLKNQQSDLQTLQSVFSQLRSKVQSLNSAASSLNMASSYNTVTSASSKTDVATLSASSGASVGSYQLAVTRIAKAEKIASSAQSSPTTALNLSGTFVVNGKAIEVKASDTLTSIAQSINSAGAGVTASLINGGDGAAYLTLTANATGVESKIQLGNLSGDLLGSLGLTSGPASVREAVGADAARSMGFSSATDPLSIVMGGTASGSFTVNGAEVVVDLAADSLQTLAAKITSAAAGTATASVVTATVNGKTVQKLEIKGAGGVMPTFEDPNGLLGAVGVLQSSYGREMIAAQDASYSIDGISMTSASNTISTVIPGATFTLVSGNETTPSTTTLTLERDKDSLVGLFKSFTDTYNDLHDFIKQYSSFDKSTYESGPLFGNSEAEHVENVMGACLFESVGSGAFTNLTQIGFGMSSGANLTLDESKLRAALESDPEGVSNLMMATGKSTNPDLSFIGGGTNTKASAGSGYAVDIARVATKGQVLSTMAQTAANVGGEILTFDGSLFASQPIDFTVDPGSTAAQLAAKINADSRLSSLVEATADAGVLKVTSLKYGLNGSFTLVSNMDAADNTSGIGKSGGVRTEGVDVAGTINGELATGSGQYLTGNESNENTAGLQIRYAGTTTGLAGSVSFCRGIASLVGYRGNGFTNSLNGTLTEYDKTLQTQIDDLTARIADMQARADVHKEELRTQFANMESSISALQQQMSKLTALSGTLLANNSK